MWLAESPWQLPSAYRILERVASSRFDGGAWLVVDRHCPDGLVEALAGWWRNSGSDVIADVLRNWNGSAPAVAIGEAWGVRADDVAALANNSTLTDRVLVVDLREASPEDVEGWARFLRRVNRAVGEVPYWATIVVAHDEAESGCSCIDGRRVLERLDARLWAGLRLRPGLRSPADLLAEAYAVELGCMDLQFIARIVGAAYEELLDPKRYFHDEWKSCVQERGDDYSLAGFENAAWRAQVQGVFPWLEERRHEIVARHGKSLSIDETQLRLGVDEVEQIELGGIARQLQSRVPVQERDYLWALARVRNALAHRRLAPPHDLELALRMAGKWG